MTTGWCGVARLTPIEVFYQHLILIYQPFKVQLRFKRINRKSLDEKV